MTPTAATALRRAAIAGGGLGATLIGHMFTAGEMRVLLIAPFIWMGLIALAILSTAGSRGVAAFRAWHPARLLVVAVAAQAGFHVALEAAPWAFGLVSTAHHSPPLLTVSAVAVHLSIGVALWVALCFGQRILVGVLAVARALLATEPPRRHARPYQRAKRDVSIAPARWRRGARTTRGPPAAPPARRLSAEHSLGMNLL